MSISRAALRAYFTVNTTSVNRSILTLLLACLVGLGLKAQNVSVLNVDTRNHPYFEAQIGLSGVGSGSASLRAGDVQISHNGQPIQAEWSECTEPTTNATVIVVVGPDVHNAAGPESLNHLRNILNAIRIPSARFASIIFSGTEYRVLAPLTGNVAEFLDDLEGHRRTSPVNTSHVHPFHSGIEVTRLLKDISGPRYLLMYGCSSLEAIQPKPYTRTWMKSLFVQLNIQGVVLADSRPSAFDALLASTFGGTACQEMMNSRADSLRVARRLASRFNGYCTFRWRARSTCSSDDVVSVLHTATNQRDTLSARRLGSSWHAIRSRPTSIRVGINQPTSRIDTTFTVVSHLPDDRIVSVTCSDTGLRVTAEHDRIDEGVACRITGRRTNHKAEVLHVLVHTEQCSLSIPVIFGWSAPHEGDNAIRLLWPRDSIQLNSSVNFRYSGVDNEAVVRVNISVDSGRTWGEIGRGSGGVIRARTPDSPSNHILIGLTRIARISLPVIDSITLAHRLGSATAFDADATGQWIAVVDSGDVFVLDAVSLDLVHRLPIANAHFASNTLYEARFTADGKSLYTSTVDGILRFDVETLRTTWIPTPHIIARNMRFAMNELQTHIGVVTAPTNQLVGSLLVAVLDSAGHVLLDSTLGLYSHAMHPTRPTWYLLPFGGVIRAQLEDAVPRLFDVTTTLVHAPASIAGIHANPMGTALAIREAVGFSPVLHRFGGLTVRDPTTFRTSSTIHIPATIREPNPINHKIIGWTDDGRKVLTYGQHLRIHSGTVPEYFIECFHDESENPTQAVHVVPNKSLISIMQPSSMSPQHEVLYLAPQHGCEPRRHIVDSALATNFGPAQSLKWHAQGRYADRLHTAPVLGISRVALDTLLEIEAQTEFILTGTRRGPKIVLQPDTVVFPATMVGHRFDTTLSRIVCNVGTGPATIVALDERQSWGRAYRTTVQLPLRIEPGECADLPFSFIPSQEGSLPGYLVVDSESAYDTLHLQGNGLPSPFRVVNTHVDWHSVPVWQRRDTVVKRALQVLTAFSVDSVRLSDVTAFADDTPWSAIPAAGEWLDLRLAFRAQGRWNHRSVLSLWHDGQATPAIVVLSGRGLKGVLAIELPDTLFSICGRPDTSDVLLRNTGDSAVRVVSAGLSESLTTAGIAWDIDAPTMLNVGDTATAKMIYAPSTQPREGRAWVAYTGIHGTDTVWAAIVAREEPGALVVQPSPIAVQVSVAGAIVDTNLIVSPRLPEGATIFVDTFGDGVQLLGPKQFTFTRAHRSITVPVRLSATAEFPTAGFIVFRSPECGIESVVPVVLDTATSPPRFDSIAVSTEHYRVRAGEEFTLRLNIDIPASLRNLVPMPLSAGIRANGTMMLPALARDRARIEIDEQQISVPMTERMQFIGLLGTDSMAVIEPWINVSTDLPVRIDRGSITILDLCESQGRVRLFDGVLVLPVVRSISPGVAEVLNAYAVSVFDILGRRLDAVSVIGEDTHRIDVPTAGVYVVVATTRDGNVTTFLFGY